MSNPSNLYAEKIYSEHPLVLWSLDDKADYISLISEDNRNIQNLWTVSNATATTSSSLGTEPFKDSIVTLVEGDVPAGPTEEIICISPDLTNFQDLNTSLGSFTVGSYFYSDSAYLQSVSIGYEYTDTTTSTIVQKLKTFPTTIFQAWSFISETFPIPDENTTLRIVIKFTVVSGGVSSSDYDFYINGTTAGQWSEEFNTQSLGVIPISVPSNIAITETNGIQADAYGLASNVGYYLISDNALVAKNTSIPLVYGASGITRLIPNLNDEPSLIIPGQGFLNKSGQHKDYTVEFWIRINSDSFTPKRIFGPISSTDGLYVEGGFLTLVIGNKFQSHFVGEWFRPMLIQIRLIRNSATVILNGEQVISLTIDTDNLDLPEILSNTDKEQDWLGFYAYADVTPIEIDCVAIYSYQVPITVAKRRWVYGQGVISPEGINSAYGGTTAFLDYPFADYTANYNYPDFAKWEQGTFDNLVSTSTALTTPQYSLPEIFTGTKTLQELYDDNKAIQSGDYKFITFRPNSSWDDVQCYFNFPRFNIINDQIHLVYAVVQINEDDESEQTIIRLYNTQTGNSFSIRKDGSEIHYYLTFNGVEEEIYITESFPLETPIAVGIDIEGMSESFGGNVAAFFGNQNGMKMYIGGDEDNIYQFTGYIYSVGISSSMNETEVEDYFTYDGIYGIANLDAGEELINHTASYTLLPQEAYNTYYLDIGVSGYWEDYMPLSYFAQYVKNDIGNEFYDLDFLQFNLGYPSPSKLLEKETTSSWSYDDLRLEFKNPLQRTYAQLDNTLFTGWNNYTDMLQHASKYYEYDTSDASVKSYITLQYIADGANSPQSNFTIVEPAKQGSIIDIDDYPNWSTTKFEVVNNTLIYPSKSIDFNDLAIVSHIEFNIRGVLTKPIALRRLELASQAFNNNSFNPVGTRFGTSLFPYKRSGIYYDYKSKNPFSIYKGSTSYLYLTRTSGIQIRGDFDPLVSRGIAMPVNQNKAINYRVSAIQMWMRYDEDLFPATETELFEIAYKGDTIKFYIVANNELGNRAKIYAKLLSTGLEFNGLSYYWNGSLVREPVVTIKEWGVLGISFSTSLNFDGYLGGINMNGPMIFNNIAYYQANNLQQVQSSLTRPWLKVKTNGVIDYEWSYWFNSFTWDGVLVINASDIYGVNPSDVYKTYLGTNKIIIDDNEGMLFGMDKLKIYNSMTWNDSVSTPV